MFHVVDLLFLVDSLSTRVNPPIHRRRIMRFFQRRTERAPAVRTAGSETHQLVSTTEQFAKLAPPPVAVYAENLNHASVWPAADWNCFAHDSSDSPANFCESTAPQNTAIAASAM